MSDYIERKAVLRDWPPCDEPADAYQYIRNYLAADVRTVVRGKWIWDDEGYHCSECFYHAYGETGEVLSWHWHYCPNCGADMREEN